MKVYRVQYQIDGEWAHEWFATKAEAKQAIKEAKDARGEDAEVSDEPKLHDIPTNKKDLVRWLNIWVGGDVL